MRGYLIFSLNKAIEVSNKISEYQLNKNLIFLTDRVIIYSLLRKKNLKVILIQKFLKQKKFNKIFLKNYKIFNKSLKNLDKRSSDKTNFYFNTFRYLGPRDYVGVISIIDALNNIVKKFKLKEIILYTGFRGAIFNANVYIKIFKHFCKVNKIKFSLDDSKVNKKIDFLINITRLLFKLNSLTRNFNFIKLRLLIKKNISKIEILKKKETILIIEPAFDLNFMNYKIRNIFFKTFSLIKNEKIYLDNSFGVLKKIKKKEPYLDIMVNHLKFNIKFNKKFIYDKSKEVLKFIKKNKVKKIFWGVSPSPYLANILDYIKNKNIEIYGVQHGGKYLIQKDDIYHQDSDYFFCDSFLAYGVSKLFNKNKYSKNTKIVETGNFKSNFLKKEFKNLKFDHLKNNILYIPISSSFLIKPFYGSMEINHYFKQIEICKSLNKIPYYKKYVKIISRSIIFGKILDQLSLEHNPINFDLVNYKNLFVKSDSVLNVVKDLMPKIIICDSLSTALYELLFTNSEIIIFLDQENLPKKDVIYSLSKRVHLVKNISEMKFAINKIKKKNILKAKNDEFLKKFYLNKSNEFSPIN